MQADVTAALAGTGAAAAVRVQVVDAIPAGAAGKRPLVVARRIGGNGAGALLTRRAIDDVVRATRSGRNPPPD